MVRCLRDVYAGARPVYAVVTAARYSRIKGAEILRKDAAMRLPTPSHSAGHTPLYKHLYFQVLVAIALGASLGYFFPSFGESLKPLGDAFVKLIKMMIAPIIFTTVVVGIAKMGDMKEVGRVGLKALLYFEAVSTVALIIGLVVVNVLRPGAGVHA